jgi:hypothetical protein
VKSAAVRNAPEISPLIPISDLRSGTRFQGWSFI